MAVQSNITSRQRELSNYSKLKVTLSHQTVLVPRFQPNMLDSLHIPPVLQYSSLKPRRVSMLLMSDSQMPQNRRNKRLDSLVTEERSLSHRQVLSPTGVLQKASRPLERLHRKLTAIHCARILVRQKLRLVVGLL